MFIDEAKLAASLNHGSIVKIFDLGVFNQRLFMVMEYVDGCSLAEYLKAYKAPLPLEIALFITIRVLDALNYAHQKKTKKDKPKALSIAIYHLKISLRPYQEQ